MTSEPAIIEFRCVTKRFGEVVATDRIDLRISAGEFLSLLGPSGCGKTTALRMIAGFEQPSEGDVLIAGETVNGVPAYRRPCAFNLAVVILIVRSRLAGIDRSLIEASEDLYATPLATFRQVTLPLLMPAIIAGFLLSFTFSFEDFIIAFFVAGPNNTLPIYIFASIRRGITPEINAIGAVVLIVSMTLLILAQFILRVGRSARPPRDQCLNDRQ
ncbi:MAG: ATP-binding cassette domain-containing protein [Methyloceanibacter sp.]